MGTITATRGYGETGYGETGYASEDVDFTEACQVTMQIVDNLKVSPSEVNMVVDLTAPTASEVSRAIDNFVDVRNSEVKDTTPFVHRHCLGYAEGGYGQGPYAAAVYCADAKSQVEFLVNNFTNVSPSQVQMLINDFTDVRPSEVLMRIDDTIKNSNCEVLAVIVQASSSQVIMNLYNTNRPRVMCEFPSRGLTGLNWTASSQAAGDFDINNLNNDIEESIWKSVSGVKTGIILTCDAEQEVFLDTFAMINHNLTTSATVTLQGSVNSGFSPVTFEENLLVEDGRIFFVSPNLPLTSHQYWRLLISDPTNTADSLEIGIVIFGSSRIMSSECTTEKIVVNKLHFKNAFKTEGFTSASNDRALRKALRFDFRDLNFDSGDFTLLDEILDFARTSLKCLWIIDPSTSSLIRRFHAFGKVKNMPSQTHKVRGKGENLDFVSLTVEVDESE